MNVNGNSVSWGPVLWCDDCDQIMKLTQPDGYWICPDCGTSVSGDDVEPPEVDFDQN